MCGVRLRCVVCAGGLWSAGAYACNVRDEGRLAVIKPSAATLQWDEQEGVSEEQIRVRRAQALWQAEMCASRRQI